MFGDYPCGHVTRSSSFSRTACRLLRSVDRNLQDFWSWHKSLSLSHTPSLFFSLSILTIPLFLSINISRMSDKNHTSQTFCKNELYQVYPMYIPTFSISSDNTISKMHEYIFYARINQLFHFFFIVHYHDVTQISQNVFE